VPRSPVPIVADIHFHVEMALAALEAGVQGLRLNPGNLRKPEEINWSRARPVIAACRFASA
jgi:(E)-4-hydroxy-3-methylbut-2-enyl-diphosphate synthase